MKTIAFAGGLLASAVLLTGCGLTSIAGPRNQEVVSYDVTDKVTRLRLDAQEGDAVIIEGAGAAVRVVETHRWSGGDQPKARHRVEGGVLLVDHDCSGWSSCSVDYKIEIPKGLPLDLDSGSGNLTLRGLTGDLRIHVGSGDVDASGLSVKNVVAEAGSGNIDLRYAAAPGNAKIEVGSGDIVLNVPDGAYAVSTDTGSGAADVKVKKDAAAPNKLSLASGSGDISVLPG
ncbi:MAG TPA: DUF4097 family beta strand repeat-containing protein [Nonomuraea sp.]|nr:DUF4097 family beta strand repeat-containing protein [Nonomuraea sp.]